MRYMRSTLKNNQSIRIKFTLSRAYVLLFTRKIREKMCKFYFRHIWKIKPRLLFGTMCWTIAFVDIKVIFTDFYQYRIWWTYWKLFKTSSVLLCIASVTEIFDSRKELEKSNSIQVFSIVKNSISVRKLNDPNLLNQLKALHQKLEIELQNIDFILRKESDFSSIVAIGRPKRPSKLARNAQKTTTVNF